MRLRRTGTEPLTARSAYGLRAVLAGLALLGSTIAAVVFAIAAGRPGGDNSAEAVVAGLCMAVAVTAFIDLLVIRQRTRGRQAGAGSRRSGMS